MKASSTVHIDTSPSHHVLRGHDGEDGHRRRPVLLPQAGRSAGVDADARREDQVGSRVGWGLAVVLLHLTRPPPGLTRTASCGRSWTGTGTATTRWARSHARRTTPSTRGGSTRRRSAVEPPSSFFLQTFQLGREYVLEIELILAVEKKKYSSKFGQIFGTFFFRGSARR